MNRRSSLHKGGEAIPEQVCLLRGVNLSVLENSKETEWLECGWRGWEEKTRANRLERRKGQLPERGFVLRVVGSPGEVSRREGCISRLLDFKLPNGCMWRKF